MNGHNKSPERSRSVQIKFWATPEERELILKKMELSGIVSLGAYLRKIAIDGMLVKLEVPELKEIVSLMRRTSNNVNQIALRLNETGRIYEVDITDIQNQQEQLWDMLNSLITKLSGIT